MSMEAKAERVQTNLCYNGFLLLDSTGFFWTLFKAEDFGERQRFSTSAQNGLARPHIGHRERKVAGWISHLITNVAKDSRGTQLLPSHAQLPVGGEGVGGSRLYWQAFWRASSPHLTYWYTYASPTRTSLLTVLPVGDQEGVGHEHGVRLLYLLQEHISHGALQQAWQFFILVTIKHAIHSLHPLCKAPQSQRWHTQPVRKA